MTMADADLRMAFVDLMGAMMEREPKLARLMQALIQRVNRGDDLRVVMGHLTSELRRAEEAKSKGL